MSSQKVNSQEWKNLQSHYEQMKSVHIRELFDKNPNRALEFTLQKEGIYLDYSKNIVTKETISLLIKLAESCNLSQEIEKMFTGVKINETEGRSVLHTALRNLSDKPVYVDDKDIMSDVKNVLGQMRKFSDKVR